MLENYLDYLVEFLQKTVQDAHANGLILGISGGIDSAVVALLAKKAFPENYLAIWMPINSSQTDWDCTQKLIEQGNLKTLTVDLTKSFQNWTETLGSALTDSTLIKGNAMARMRMTTLYALGQAHGYLVLGTDNLDEWYTGYFTKFGDGAADVTPLIRLLKSEVRQAAKLLNVPQAIIDRQPTAGLWEGQTDEKEMGLVYDELDAYLIDPKSVSSEVSKKIETLHLSSEHKRNLPKWPDIFQREEKKS